MCYSPTRCPNLFLTLRSGNEVSKMTIRSYEINHCFGLAGLAQGGGGGLGGYLKRIFCHILGPTLPSIKRVNSYLSPNLGLFLKKDAVDHLQPIRPIFSPKFPQFFTFILGGQFLLPQRANNEKREFTQLQKWTRQRGLCAWGIQTGPFPAC